MIGKESAFVLVATVDDQATPKIKEIGNEMKNAFGGVGAAGEVGGKIGDVSGKFDKLDFSVKTMSRSMMVMNAAGVETGGAFTKIFGAAGMLVGRLGPLEIAFIAVGAGVAGLTRLIAESTPKAYDYSETLKSLGKNAADAAEKARSAKFALAGMNENERKSWEAEGALSIARADLADKKEKLLMQRKVEAGTGFLPGINTYEQQAAAPDLIRKYTKEIEDLTKAESLLVEETAHLKSTEADLALVRASRRFYDKATGALGEIGGGSQGETAEQKAAAKAIADRLRAQEEVRVRITEEGIDLRAEATKKGNEEELAEMDRHHKRQMNILNDSIALRNRRDDERIAEQKAREREWFDFDAKMTADEIDEHIKQMIKDEATELDIKKYYADAKTKISKEHNIDMVTELANDASGIMGTVIMAGLNGTSAGLAKAISDQLKSLAVMAAIKAIWEIAEAASMLAGVYTAPLAAGHFAAAAKWGAVAAAAGVAGVAIGSASGGGGGGGVSGSASRGGSDRGYVQENPAEREPSRYTIAIYGPAWFGNDADKALYETVKNYEKSQRPGSASEGF
jgi:hypothetical protein